jgi:hypothetical protein
VRFTRWLLIGNAPWQFNPGRFAVRITDFETMAEGGKLK